MERLLKNNNVVKVVAFFLALMLWVYVTGDALRPGEDITRTFRNVPLSWLNLNDELAIMNIPSEIDVDLRGRADILDNITPQNLKVFVDMKDLGEGQHHLTPNAEVPRGVRVLFYRPQQVTIELEEIEAPQKPVNLEIIGEHKEGLVMGEPRILPNSVFVRGPRSILANVFQVKAVVDVHQADGDKVQVVPVVAVTEDGQEVEGVVVNPAMVEVLIPFTQPQKAVPVRVPLEGDPAEGYQIRQIDIHPATVTIQGKVELLEKITEVITSPVVVSEAMETITVELTLIAPPGVELLSMDKVTVDVIVDPQS
jgi:YbbR domain-containing protein